MIDVVFVRDERVVFVGAGPASGAIFIQGAESAAAAVAAHEAKTDPHPQYMTSAETSAAIAPVQSDIDAHEADTSNPHSTTAAQVGAIALTDLDNDSTLAANSASKVASQQATRAYVVQKIADLVASSPASLDTLNELATALGDDPNFATTMATALGNRLRVDAAQGLNGTQQAQGQSNLGLAAGAVAANTDGLGEGSSNLYFTDSRARAALVAAVDAADGASITPAITAQTRNVVRQTNTQTAGTLTLNNPTGSPVDGQFLWVRVTCTNVQTMAFGAAYRGTNQLSLPSVTTGGGKLDRMLFEYVSAASKWDLVGIDFGA